MCHHTGNMETMETQDITLINPTNHINHNLKDFLRVPTDWDNKFLGLAQHISKWSLDPSTKVGAVIADKNKRVVSVGYNGFPRGIADTDERLNNRELKYKMVCHAEINAILFSKQDLTGCIMYTWPFMPCSACAGAIIQSGISRVVAPYSENERWLENFILSVNLLTEAEIELNLIQSST